MCVQRACVFFFGGGGSGGRSAGKGCVYPICSLPLPCGRKNHWPALRLIPQDTEAERQAQDRRGQRSEGARQREGGEADVGRHGEK